MATDRLHNLLGKRATVIDKRKLYAAAHPRYVGQLQPGTEESNTKKPGLWLTGGSRNLFIPNRDRLTVIDDGDHPTLVLYASAEDAQTDQKAAHR